MIEVELKCRLSPELFSRLQKKLQQMRFDGTAQNVDIYYDTRDFAFLQQAVFVRVRNHQQLDFKFNESAEKAHFQSTERTFSLFPEPESATQMNVLFAHFLPHWSASPTVAEAVMKNDLIELARINNKREAYTNDEVHVSVDHVEGLGDFLEVETRSEEGADTSKALATLEAFVADLHVQHIKVGYVELWLRAHNPRAYQLGQYHLE